MFVKKINLLPSEQKALEFQQKAKIGMIALLVLLGSGAGGFELYIRQLEDKQLQLEADKSEMEGYRQMSVSLETQVKIQDGLIRILENKDFPIHDFLFTLSNEIPKNLWLYSVSGEDFKVVEQAVPTDHSNPMAPVTTEPNGQSPTPTVPTPTPTPTPTTQPTETTQPTDPSSGQPMNPNESGQRIMTPTNPNAHKTLVIRGAGTSPTEIGQFVQILNAKNYIKSATLSSVEEYLANEQVYQAFEIRVEGR